MFGEVPIVSLRKVREKIDEMFAEREEKHFRYEQCQPVSSPERAPKAKEEPLTLSMQEVLNNFKYGKSSKAGVTSRAQYSTIETVKSRRV